MRMYDLIMKKRNGQTLSKKEILYMIREYVKDRIPDYQMSAFLMAVYFKGMTEDETLAMTQAVTHSGEIMDLSAIEGIKADKHSTGGVGDKTTLIIAPIAAACGVKVAKMSGRGLGHTGGTVDKLESIPGMKTTLSREEFFAVVNKTGLSVIGQLGSLAPADKKLYAIRDVTATVDSLSLIAVSIMSKKLATGNDCILLDVKTGSGAFMKSVEDSISLAKEMVAIGENAGRKTVALVTDMDVPLGHNIGNSLEVIEAVETLKGNGPADLADLCRHLASDMLFLAGKGTLSECHMMVEKVIVNGEALGCLAAMVEAQGGDPAVIWHPEKFAKAPFRHEVRARESGWIMLMDAESCGIASSMLGAGRETVDSAIDYTAGIILQRKVGDYVDEGETIAVMYASDESLFAPADIRYTQAVHIGKRRARKKPLIYARVARDTVERLA